MTKEVNLIKILFIFWIVLVAVLSFFPCAIEYVVDGFNIQLETGVEAGNAEWIILCFSIAEIVFLLLEKAITVKICIWLSLLEFLLTLIWPLYLSISSPHFLEIVMSTKERL